MRYLSESVPAAPGALAPGVRWTIVALLTCFSTISYIERVNLAVAARFIRAEFGLTESQIGYSFSAFLVGYTLAQVPAGFLIDRYGWKRVLVAAGSLWFLITLLLGVFVGLLAANAAQVIATLVISRLLLGLVEAPTYPGASAAIVRWFPTPARGLPNAIIQAASYLGEAMTLVLLASITAYLGWRHALFASAVPALLIALAVWRWGSERPDMDDRVTPEELAYIRSNLSGAGTRGDTAVEPDSLWSRRLVYLSLAYGGHGYVAYLFFFWFYIYLVDERGFTVAGGGLVGALPSLAAAMSAIVGGRISDRLAHRFGGLRGRRAVIMTGGLVGAVSVLIGAFVANTWIAVSGFILAVASRGLVEGSFWALANQLGGTRTGLFGGVMNMVSNFGGIISTLLAPVLVARLGWNFSFAVAAAVTVSTGLLMLGIREMPRAHLNDGR
jgi:MFS transporter, ACS family, glucarate transporter